MSQSVSEPVSDTISSITSRMERISLPVLPCERSPSAVERVIIKGKVLVSVRSVYSHEPHGLWGLLSVGE